MNKPKPKNQELRVVVMTPITTEQADEMIKQVCKELEIALSN